MTVILQTSNNGCVSLLGAEKAEQCNILLFAFFASNKETRPIYYS